MATGDGDLLPARDRRHMWMPTTLKDGNLRLRCDLCGRIWQCDQFEPKGACRAR